MKGHRALTKLFRQLKKQPKYTKGKADIGSNSSRTLLEQFAFGSSSMPSLLSAKGRVGTAKKEQMIRVSQKH